jgi:hypothetical protein
LDTEIYLLVYVLPRERERERERERLLHGRREEGRKPVEWSFYEDTGRMKRKGK